MSQLDLFGDPNAPTAQLGPYPNLRKVVSVGMHGRDGRPFVDMLRRWNVELVIDTRLVTTYRRGGSFAGNPTRLMGGLRTVGVQYLHLPLLAPSQELRRDLHAQMEDANMAARHPYAWTEFLEGYVHLMAKRRALRTVLEPVLQQAPEVIAVACSCPRHEDCHRQALAGIMGKWIAKVRVNHAYHRLNHKPPRRSPKRVLLRDIPNAGLNAQTEV